MGKRLVMGLVTLLAAVAIGGIGFAAFTASATISGSATAGTYGPLTWGEGSNTPTVTDASQCAVGTVSGSSWTGVSGTYFAPGDGCSFSNTIYQGGNLPGTLSESITFTDTVSGCGLQYWAYTDSIVGSPTFTSGEGNGPVVVTAGAVSVSAGGSVSFSGSYTLMSGAPNACQGDVFSFSATITGTAS